MTLLNPSYLSEARGDVEVVGAPINEESGNAVVSGKRKAQDDRINPKLKQL
jgi:hypothetical protein